MLKLTARTVSTAKGKVSVWYITGTCPYTQEQFRVSTRCHRKIDAEVALVQITESQRKKALFGKASGVATFGEAIQEYLRKGGEARFLNPLNDHFGDTPMRDIEDVDISRMGALAYPHATPATLVRQWYGPFEAVWRAAVKSKMAFPRDFSKPKVTNKQVRAPDDEWLIKLLRASSNLNQRAVIVFMSFSGGRSSEVINIKCQDYDPLNAKVLIGRTKNNDGRLVALPPFVNEILSLLDLSNPNAPLFGYASRFSLTRIVMRSCRRAKIEYFSPHKVGRHAFARRFLADGNSLKALMDAGGWRSVTAVIKYAHLESKVVDQAVAGVATPLSTADLGIAGLSKPNAH